jgi:hypothetical protein
VHANASILNPTSKPVIRRWSRRWVRIKFNRRINLHSSLTAPSTKRWLHLRCSRNDYWISLMLFRYKLICSSLRLFIHLRKICVFCPSLLRCENVTYSVVICTENHLAMTDLLLKAFRNWLSLTNTSLMMNRIEKNVVRGHFDRSRTKYSFLPISYLEHQCTHRRKKK